MTALDRAWRVLRSEGPSGVLGRLRFRQAPPPPASPSLRGPVAVIGNGPMAGLLRDVMASHGIEVVPEAERRVITLGTGHNPTLRPGDIIVPTTEAAPGTVRFAWDQVALAVEFDPARMASLQARPHGRPHWIAIPPPPSAEAGRSAWDKYAIASRTALTRLLIFCEAAPADAVDFRPAFERAAATPPTASLPGPEVRLGVSLPETPDRRRAFLEADWTGVTMVDGLRQVPGWKGAALTYRGLAQAAIARGDESMLVCQDDALPGPGFAQRYPAALRYWERSGAAMFAGLVTDVDDSIAVLRVVETEGVTFLHLNRSVGLVFNIFGRPMLHRMAAWDEGDSDVKNTIDRHISRAEGVEVVTCLPYLVHHREDQHSAVWQFHNRRYSSIIRASERRLARKAGIALAQVAH